MADALTILRNLSMSSSSSVETGIGAHKEPRVSIDHPLEGWLVDSILEELTAQERRLSLIVVAGNAGDGKSFLFRQIRQRLEHPDVGLDPSDIAWKQDGTKSNEPDEELEDALATYFAGFRDDGWSVDKLHVAAINTGTFLRFATKHGESPDKAHKLLCDIIKAQLGIQAPPAENEDDAWSDDVWQLFDQVLVIDLDNRMLQSLETDEDGVFMRGFFDELLDTLSPENSNYLLKDADTSCFTCPNQVFCPVETNLKALQNERVRARLRTLLLDIALENRIHLGPRSLWHLVYEATVGGLDAAVRREGKPVLNCSTASSIDEELVDKIRVESLFFESIFRASHDEAAQKIPLLKELERLDPIRRFSLDAHDEALSAALSLELDEAIAKDLLGPDSDIEPRTICALHESEETSSRHVELSRRRSFFALRRAFFFAERNPDSDRHSWLRAWAKILLTRKKAANQHHRDRSEVGGLRESNKHLAAKLKNALRALHASAEAREFWQLKLPWSTTKPLYAQNAETTILRSELPVASPKVVGPDAYRKSGPRQADTARSTTSLNEVLSAYPLILKIPYRGGIVARVDWPLYRLMMRVDDQKYAAGCLEAERVQQLERIGTRMAIQKAYPEGDAEREVFVIDSETDPVTKHKATWEPKTDGEDPFAESIG